MPDKIVDFTKLARRATKSLRSACDHTYQTKRSGVEKCSACGDEFPCRSVCYHIDCWCRRLKIGQAEVYPESFAQGATKITDKDGTVLYDTTDDDPAEWTLPLTGEEGLDVD